MTDIRSTPRRVTRKPDVCVSPYCPTTVGGECTCEYAVTPLRTIMLHWIVAAVLVVAFFAALAYGLFWFFDWTMGFETH